MKKKITFLALSAMLFALSLPAEAQQPKKVPQIGFLASGSPSSNVPSRKAFQQGLRELGYVEGENIIIEYRWAEGKLDRLPELATELVRLKVDPAGFWGWQFRYARAEASNYIDPNSNDDR
jgi:ABC-type uncharacterized transport system substrate-binding protein